jgi:hypothetical protein
MQLFSILLVYCVTLFKPTGSATAYLTCKSESGRTTFKAEISDIDGELQLAELTVDNVKLKFTGDDNAYVVFDRTNGVYTIFLESKPLTGSDFSKYKFLKFWAIPKTFNVTTAKDNRQVYGFKGKLYSTEPRKGKDLQTPEIELNCTLEYHI